MFGKPDLPRDFRIRLDARGLKCRRRACSPAWCWRAAQLRSRRQMSRLWCSLDACGCPGKERKYFERNSNFQVFETLAKYLTGMPRGSYRVQNTSTLPVTLLKGKVFLLLDSIHAFLFSFAYFKLNVNFVPNKWNEFQPF